MNQTLVKYNSLFKQSELSKNRLYLEGMIKNILTTKDISFKEDDVKDRLKEEVEESIKMPSLSKISKNQYNKQEVDVNINTL